MGQLIELAVKIFYTFIGVISQLDKVVERIFNTDLFKHAWLLAKDLFQLLLAGLEALLQFLKSL